MASDHRMRELHAGKRTAQEMGWDSAGRSTGLSFPSDISFIAHKPSQNEDADRLMVQRNPDVLPSGGGYTDRAKWSKALRRTPGHRVFSQDYVWAVHTRTDNPNLPESGSDLGRGKSTEDVIYSPPNSAMNFRSTTGRASTPKRAMIAAEAMKKRIDEGRDLKTGRPKK